VKRRGLGLIAAACLCFAGPAAAQQGQAPHVLRYANLGDVTSLNPMFSQQLTLSFMSQLTMAWLVRFDRNGKPFPELALAVPSRANGGVSADGKTIVYHLRKGVRWSDGAPFDADDVAFTTRLILDPHTNLASREGWELIEKVDEPDKHTIVYHLRTPFSPFYAQFFSPANAVPAILPKHLLERTADINTDPYNAKPVGIGPFRYVEWRRGDRVIMEANPYYWRGLPKLKRVEYAIIPNRDTVFVALQTGAIDLWPIAPRAYYERLKALPGVTVARRTGLGYGHIDFNVRRPLLADVRVRRALALGIDRATLRAKIGHGIGLIQDGVASPAGAFFDPKIATTPFDLRAAGALLDAAGWSVLGADGIRTRAGMRLSLEFASSAGTPDNDSQIELIRSWWKAIGVELERKDYDPTMLFALAQNGGIMYGGKFDAVVFAWYPSVTGDLSVLYGCDAISPKGQNDSGWCDPRAQAAMEAFKRSYDPGEQKKESARAQEILAADVPTFVLNVNEDLYAQSARVKNFHPNSVTAFDDFMNVDVE
jgi:peptide/nickel transport system substrate-binding protein